MTYRLSESFDAILVCKSDGTVYATIPIGVLSAYQRAILAELLENANNGIPLTPLFVSTTP